MSGSTGAERVKSRNDYKVFIDSYKNLISKFDGFKSLNPSGSYNSNQTKNDFGDIDLVVHIESDKEKSIIKKQLMDFFSKFPDNVIVPFSSEKYKGKKSNNTGEIVTVRYQDPKLGYSVQIDNIIALDEDERDFKLKFLDMPAEKQGLVLGLVKVATLETDPSILFKKLNIKVDSKIEENQEFEFNLSSQELQLRLVTYKPGTFEQLDKEVVWRTKDFSKVEELLFKFDLSQDFDSLLKEVNSKLKNQRSKNRIQGVFKSMITVKSGEEGTAKGDSKIASLNKIINTLKENKSSFREFLLESYKKGR